MGGRCMTLIQLLEYIDDLFLPLGQDSDDEEIEEILAVFNYIMDTYCKKLSKELFNNLMRYSKSECNYWKKLFIVIGFFTIRPKKEQRINIEVHLARQFIQKSYVVPSVIEIKLNIGGHRELQAFKEMYYNYRRIVELMFKDVGIEFDGFRLGERNLTAKLDNLLQEAERDEYFDQELSFTTCYTRSQNESDIIRGLMIFIALYDSTYNYLRRDKKPDKLLAYFNELFPAE